MRLLSYNIHKGVGGRDRRYRLGRIEEVIDRENPDLICLQEVTRYARRSRFDDQPRHLAQRFSSAARLFQQNVHYRRGGYGNLLLSRWEIASKHQISLRMPPKKPRGAQLAVVQTPEGPLHVINLHLGLAEKERQWQVERLLQHHLFHEASKLPTIIAGDTNDWRNNLAANALVDNNFRHLTSPISRYRTFPAYLPAGSLDKLFVRGRVDVHHVRVVRTKLAKQASDHLPVVIDFHLA